MSESILVIPGFARAPVRCHVVIATGQQGRAVLVGELEDNPGTSVTNALEFVAESVARGLLEDDRNFAFYEYVPKGLPKLLPTFYRIEWRGEPGQFSMPEWNVMDPLADQWLRFFKDRVTETGYTSDALKARGVEVIDMRDDDTFRPRAD